MQQGQSGIGDIEFGLGRIGPILGAIESQVEVIAGIDNRDRSFAGL